VLLRVLVWLLAVAAFGFQTEDRVGASISGQVVSQPAGLPLKDAIVKLQRIGVTREDPIVRQTNDEGRFVLTDLHPGEWELSADRRGYVRTVFRATRYSPQGSHISLERNQQIKDIVLKLAPQAVIAGRVLDAEGEPMEGAHVVILKADYIDAGTRWSEVASADTLDNGEYRIPRVSTGRYLVRCTTARMERLPSKSGTETTYTATYHPNVTDQSMAVSVDVREPSEIRGIDIHLKLVRVFHVRGQFQPPTGRQAPGYVALIGGYGPVPPNYLFDFSRVPPGSYTVYGWWSDEAQFLASRPVDVVDQHVENLVISPAPEDEIPGALKLKLDDPHVDLTKSSVEILPIFVGTGSRPAVPQRAKLGDDLKFRYRLDVREGSFGKFSVRVSNLPEGCYVESTRYGEREVPQSGIEYSSGTPLEITIAADGGHVDGTTVAKDDHPFGEAVVVLLRADGKGPPRSSLTSAQGAFHFTGIPPGDYKVMAWEDIGRDEIGNPEIGNLFNSLATIVKVASSESVRVSVRVITQETAQ
jgi:hypothetical protein